MKFIKPEMWLKEVFMCSINILLKSSNSKRESTLGYTLENRVKCKQVSLEIYSEEIFFRERFVKLSLTIFQFLVLPYSNRDVLQLQKLELNMTAYSSSSQHFSRP